LWGRRRPVSGEKILPGNLKFCRDSRDPRNLREKCSKRGSNTGRFEHFAVASLINWERYPNFRCDFILYFVIVKQCLLELPPPLFFEPVLFFVNGDIYMADLKAS